MGHAHLQDNRTKWVLNWLFMILGEHDYINVNGSGARAILKSEDDVCDNKSINKKSEHYSNNSNNTRTLTQQSSLVAPSEVVVSISPSQIAKPVLTPNGKIPPKI